MRGHPGSADFGPLRYGSRFCDRSYAPPVAERRGSCLPERNFGRVPPYVENISCVYPAFREPVLTTACSSFRINADHISIMSSAKSQQGLAYPRLKAGECARRIFIAVLHMRDKALPDFVRVFHFLFCARHTYLTSSILDGDFTCRKRACEEHTLPASAGSCPLQSFYCLLSNLLQLHVCGC